jgi:hypothetical protein
MNRAEKQDYERRVFEALAPLVGLVVVPGSIRQPDPPDIVCEIVGSGPLAVELVAIDAADTRTRLNNMFITKKSWADALATWSLGEQTALRAGTSDVFLSLDFDNAAGARDRRVALRAIQGLLLRQPGFTGKVSIQGVGRPPGLNAATVHRGGVTNGPRVSPFSVGSWQPPQVEMIEKKLSNRNYQSVAPLELFAYATHDEPNGAVGSMEQIEQTITKHMPGSSFTRVRVFHLGFLQHLFTYPE